MSADIKEWIEELCTTLGHSTQALSTLAQSPSEVDVDQAEEQRRLSVVCFNCLRAIAALWSSTTLEDLPKLRSKESARLARLGLVTALSTRLKRSAAICVLQAAAVLYRLYGIGFFSASSGPEDPCARLLVLISLQIRTWFSACLEDLSSPQTLVPSLESEEEEEQVEEADKKGNAGNIEEPASPEQATEGVVRKVPACERAGRILMVCMDLLEAACIVLSQELNDDSSKSRLELSDDDIDAINGSVRDILQMGLEFSTQSTPDGGQEGVQGTMLLILQGCTRALDTLPVVMAHRPIATTLPAAAALAMHLDQRNSGLGLSVLHDLVSAVQSVMEIEELRADVVATVLRNEQMLRSLGTYMAACLRVATSEEGTGSELSDAAAERRMRSDSVLADASKVLVASGCLSNLDQQLTKEQNAALSALLPASPLLMQWLDDRRSVVQQVLEQRRRQASHASAPSSPSKAPTTPDSAPVLFLSHGVAGVRPTLYISMAAMAAGLCTLGLMRAGTEVQKVLEHLEWAAEVETALLKLNARMRVSKVSLSDVVGKGSASLAGRMHQLEDCLRNDELGVERSPPLEILVEQLVNLMNKNM